MISALKAVTALIFASIIIYAIYQYKNFHFIETYKYSSSFSQFISLKGTDEYVISELKTAEKFDDHWVKKIHNTGIVVARVDAEISMVASFKYYVKLGELKYAIENDTLVFNVPNLYLSKPVAYDSSTVQRKCDADGLATCKDTLDKLIAGTTEKLEVKGNLAMTNMYEKSAKALADNFNSFAKNNNKEVFYKNIAVIFANEPSQSRRMFNYNKSFCGNEPCAVEIPIGNGRFLTIQ
jgi:hypothetical protein